MSKTTAKLTVQYVLLVLMLASPVISGEECQGPSYECALHLVRDEQFNSAVETLEDLHQRIGVDLRSLNLLGIALTGMGEVQEANQRFMEAISIDPGFYPALKNLAVNEFRSGERRLAQSHFEAVLEGHPTDEVAHLHLGEMAFDTENWSVAASHYENGIDLVLDSPDVMLRYADSLLRLGEVQEAVSMLSGLSTDRPELQFRAGTLLGTRGRYEEAAMHFGLSAEGHSDPYSALYNQVLMLVRGSEFAEAIEVAKTVFERGYQRAELYNLVSEAYLGSHQLQEAYDALRSATRVDPGHEKSYGDLISLCMGFSNFQLGLDIANVGIYHLPTSYRLHLQRGVMQAKLGRLTEAQEDFQHAARLAPQEPLPHATLAIALMQQGSLRDAILILREQLESNPDYFLSRYLLGEALVRSGVGASGIPSDRALESFEMAVRLHPDFAPARVSLGKLLLKRDQVDAAIEHLESAMALEPNESAPIYQLARAYQRQGDSNRAEELMARVRVLAEERRNETMDSVLRDVIRESRSKER